MVNPRSLIIYIIMNSSVHSRCRPLWKRSLTLGLLLVLFVCVSGFHVASGAETTKRKSLVLSGPPSVVSWPFLRMVETGALKEWTDHLRFELWTNPDQLRVNVLHQRVDYTAVPVNVAANLHTRGAKVRLLNVSTWGILWMVSRDAHRKKIEDFRGETIAVPFRGDMPDLLLKLLVEQAGMKMGKDIKARYVATPPDAAQLLIGRRVRHALLAEPAVSMVLRRSGSFPVGLVAPDLHRSFSVSKEWGRLYQTEARIPQAGIATVGGQTDAALDRAVAKAYAQALEWCVKHPEACGKMVAKHIDLLSAKAATDAIKVSPMEAVPTAKAADALRVLFKRLHGLEPGLIGGKMPDEAFYSFTGEVGRGE